MQQTDVQLVCIAMCVPYCFRFMNFVLIKNQKYKHPGEIVPQTSNYNSMIKGDLEENVVTKIKSLFIFVIADFYIGYSKI